MTKRFSKMPKKEEIQVQRELLTKPIYFDVLIRDGALVKKGAWYIAKDMRRLGARKGDGGRAGRQDV